MKKDVLKFRVNVTDIIKNTFQDLGYNIEMKLLNSADFGVPQKRQRVIFIGIKKEIDKEIKYPIESHNKDGTDGKLKWVSDCEAIDDLKDFPENTRIPEKQKSMIKITGKYMLKCLMEFQLHNHIHVVFCGNKHNAFLTVSSILKRVNEMYTIGRKT